MSNKNNSLILDLKNNIRLNSDKVINNRKDLINLSENNKILKISENDYIIKTSLNILNNSIIKRNENFTLSKDSTINISNGATLGI